jgi:transposase-like protein
MVEECLTAETSIVEVARRHDVHPNQLHGWRRQARLGLLGTDAAAVAQECRFVPIAVATVEDKISNLSKEAADDALPIIELVLRNGRVLRLPEGVTPARAAALAEALEG